MTSPTLLSLAARVESLMGPCRETDLAISVAINFKGAFEKDREWKWSVMADDIEGHKNGNKSFLDPAQFVPRWTGSLDVAENLMPNNTGVIQYWILGKKPTVSLQRHEWDFHLIAETKILTLCAGALHARARSALEASHG